MVNTDKKIIIIGGGIAGLTAGIFAQKYGFVSTIYEKNSFTGGECTGWDKNGFHIDGCIHWLAGTREGRGMNRLWNEIGAFNGTEIYQPESFVTVLHETGNLNIWRDKDKLKMQLLEISPDDKEVIEELMECISAFETFEPSVDKPVDLMSIFEMAGFIFKNRKVFGRIRKYSQIPLADYIKRFKSPQIRTALEQVIPGRYSTHNLFFTLAAFLSDNAGIPRGGSRAMAERLENNYLDLGGTIAAENEIREILIADDSVSGVVRQDGTKDLADYVITACDPHIVFTKLLKGEFVDPMFSKRYDDSETYPLQTSVLASFSVDSDISSIPRSIVFKPNGLKFEDRNLEILKMKHFCHEPSFSPEGKSVIIVLMDATYEWWKNTYQDKEIYNEEKKRLAADIIKQFELRFPELYGKLDLLDIVTPITYEQNFGAYKGSWISFGNTPLSQPLRHSGKVEGLKNLYMAGQWFMTPGGLPAAAITGKWAIKRICRENRIKCQDNLI
jgi:phytoene desaturase